MSNLDPRYSPAAILAGLYVAVDSASYSASVCEVAEQSTHVHSAAGAEIAVRLLIGRGRFVCERFGDFNESKYYEIGPAGSDFLSRNCNVSDIPNLTTEELRQIDFYVQNER